VTTTTTTTQGPDCHVVAVRVTAEDAADGFKPTSGRIDELHFRPTPEVSREALAESPV
jgi:acetyl-CoA carboxylase/biotin carboxylase 1